MSDKERHDVSEERSNERPLVTIGIPTLNRLSYLRLAVASALAQDYEALEVVVSDNASSDGTQEILEQHQDSRLRVVRQTERIPMTENWNACLKAARGKYFLLLSDDDVLEPAAVRKLVAGYRQGDLEGAPPGIVYGGGCIIDANGKVVRPFKHSALRESATDLILAFFAGQRDLWFCAILFRTADVLPGFPTEFLISSDSAVWIDAVARYGSAAFVAEELVRYRVHQSTTNVTPLTVWQQEMRQLQQRTLDCLRKCNDPDPQFDKRFKRTMDVLHMRMLSNQINQDHRQARMRGIRAYARSARHFQGLAGLRVAALGLSRLCLEGRQLQFLRRLKRRQAVTVCS